MMPIVKPTLRYYGSAILLTLAGFIAYVVVSVATSGPTITYVEHDAAGNFTHVETQRDRAVDRLHVGDLAR